MMLGIKMIIEDCSLRGLRAINPFKILYQCCLWFICLQTSVNVAPRRVR